MKDPIPWLVLRLPLLAALGFAAVARAELPPELAAALHNLVEQRSYSWEYINGDPGIVTENIETRLGTVRAVQQSTEPHVLGSLTRTGDFLLKRDWPDGLEMDTLVTAKGDLVTNTPEGWMTSREVLDALADEQVHNDVPTPRFTWLRRADRPRVRRPDQELAVLLQGNYEFEVSGDAYITHIPLKASGAAKSDDDSPLMIVNFTVHVTGGVIRTYEIKIDFSRATARGHVQVPVSDDRLVILTYVPVPSLDVPDEAWAKLKPTR